MELEIGPHLEEVELEQYSMGNLPEGRLEQFEGHFLACDACQDRLLEMESYVNAMRSASPKVRPARRAFLDRLWRPRPAWAAAFALSAVAVVAGVWMVAPARQPEMTAVTLRASRGNDISPAEAPVGKILILKIDLTELPASTWYRVEVVDSRGNHVWDAVSRPRNSSIEQPMTKPLEKGQYFARLYSPAGQLLREFSLGVVR